MNLPQFILDPIIRRHARAIDTPVDRFSVRVARTTSEYEDAFLLVRAAYVYQGIDDVSCEEMRITPQHMLPEATVIVAYEGDEIVGTMTVTLDSPAGLPLDKDYADELGRLRRTGARIVEYGSLAVVQPCWGSGVTQLINFAAHQIAVGIYQATHSVVGINPKAVAVHRAFFGYRKIGQAKQHAQLTAPVVGLVVELDRLEAHVGRHFRRKMRSGYKPVEHLRGKPFRGVEVPRGIATHEFGRWKLPRHVFHDLFIRRTGHLSTADRHTRMYVAECRSRQTLVFSGQTVSAREASLSAGNVTLLPSIGSRRTQQEKRLA